MESRSCARGRANGAICNRLLFEWEIDVRQCRSYAGRIFPGAGSVAGSTTQTTRRANKVAARNDSRSVVPTTRDERRSNLSAVLDAQLQSRRAESFRGTAYD